MARIFAESLKKQLEKDKAKAKIDVEDKEFYKFTEEEVLCAEIAGLCHDLGLILSMKIHIKLVQKYYRTWTPVTHV